MKIFVSIPDNGLRKTFITEKSLKRLMQIGEVTLNPLTTNLTADELVEKAFDADVIVCTWQTVKFTKELTKRLPNLKIIAYTAGSMATVVEKDVLDNGIIALTGNYKFAESVAEGCISYILSSLRRQEKYINIMRSGLWRDSDFYFEGLYGKKVGIVGFGEIAKNLVRLLKAFNTEILVNSGHMTDEEAENYGVKKASKEEIFSECDIVSLHMSLTEKTAGCIDKNLLSLLKPGTLFVNTARAGLVDYKALTSLLSENRFRAVLDVFPEEPLREDSPLRKMENVSIFPHMAGPSFDMREKIVLAFADDFTAYKKGKPLKNRLNPTSLLHMTGSGT